MVRAPPRVLPRSLAPSGVLGGWRSGPGSPLPSLGLCASRWAGPWRSCAGGRVGGGGACAVPPVCAAGGASRAGGRSASFRPSAFPGQATKRVSLPSFWSWGAWPPYRSSSCSPAFSGRDLCGVLARWRGLACSPRFLWGLAAEGGGGPCCGSSLGRGEGGPSPLPRGAEGWCPRGLRAGRGVGGAGGRAAASLLPLWSAARGSLPWFPSCRRRTPPRRSRLVGVAGPPQGGGG